MLPPYKEQLCFNYLDKVTNISMVSYICKVLVFVRLWTLVRSSGLVEIKKKIPTEPVIIGQEFVIRCITLTNFGGKILRQWSVGSDIICSQDSEYCTNSTKYEMMVNASHYFELKIKDFQLTDIAEYTCHYGFITDYYKLGWDNETFVSLPEDDGVINNITTKDNLVLLNVRLEKVFPVPKCKMLIPYSPEFDVNCSVTKELLDRGPFYTVNVTGSLEISSTICPKEIELMCFFEPNTRKTWSKMIECPVASTKDTSDLIKGVVAAVCFFGLLCFLCCILIRSRRS